MTLNEYQDFAIRSAIYPTDMKVIYPCIGLSGECGEVAEKIKKGIRDNNGLFNIRDIGLELGDVLWYVANIANDLGLTLEEIAIMNEDKIIKRKQNNTLRGNGDYR